jgi:hypothetical protein
MKKTILTILMACMSGSAFAGSKSVLAKYDCGQSRITVSSEDGSFSIRQTYSTLTNGKKHVVTIDSAKANLKDLEEQFQGNDMTVDDDTQKETGLPNGSLAFIGFHFPNGEMYVTAEGDTNEEGYTFAVERGILEGAKTIQAAQVFWNDRSDSSVQVLSCQLVK